MANKKKSGGRPHHGGNARKRSGGGGDRQSSPKQPPDGAGEGTAASTPKAKTAARKPNVPKSAATAGSKKPTGSRGPTRQERIEARRRSKRRKERMTRIGLPIAILVVIIGFAFLAKGGTKGTGPSATGSIEVAGSARETLIPDGEKIPTFTAPELGGSEFDLADYEGDPYVLAVWAPWCPHCQKELPIVDRVSREYPAVPVVTIATAIDKGTVTPEDFMTDSMGVTPDTVPFPVAVDDDTQTLAEALGVTSYPTIYFVGTDGTVVSSGTGEMAEEQIVENFKELDKLVPKDAPESPTPSPEKNKDEKGNKAEESPAPTASPTP